MSNEAPKVLARRFSEKTPKKVPPRENERKKSGQGGSPRRPRAFWGPGAAFWGFLGARGAVGKKAGNGPNRTRLIEIGLR